MNDIFKGKLIGYFETGTEGVFWALQNDNLPGYEGLTLLEAGDKIEIYAKDMERTQRPSSNVYQPKAMGMWIHWTQYGFCPDKWASYFMDGDHTGIIQQMALKK
jgi:hypothetical protein